MSQHESSKVNTSTGASARPETIYFAYGSNLGFEQMASRCPSSVFLGRARLHNYEFQINERGYANVIPSQDSAAFVEGLCYRLSPSDERRLDRSEGVPFAYERHVLELEFWYAEANLIGRTVANIVECLEHEVKEEVKMSLGYSDDVRGNEESRGFDGAEKIQDDREETQAEPDQHAEDASRGQMISAMVYLSPNYTSIGLPWYEYIGRMNTGFDQALKLGISKQYVHNCIQTFLKHSKDDSQ